ncbi:MAG: hypothetical protein ACRDVP_08935 [Acidimicrobiales bacterium]
MPSPGRVVDLVKERWRLLQLLLSVRLDLTVVLCVLGFAVALVPAVSAVVAGTLVGAAEKALRDHDLSFGALPFGPLALFAGLLLFSQTGSPLQTVLGQDVAKRTDGWVRGLPSPRGGSSTQDGAEVRLLDSRWVRW